MNDALLVLNAGSSTLKYALFEHLDPLPETPLQRGEAHIVGDDPAARRDALDAALAQSGGAGESGGRRIVAVGHRIVHGGRDFAAPQRIDAQLLAALRRLEPLAPLHQPHNLAGVDAAVAALPHAAQIACFDTAFHRSQPHLAQLYALPRRYAEAGVLRYGFHGLSYEYIAAAAPRWLTPQQAQGRILVAHLGAGASLCGMRQGRSVAASMGFSTLDGLMMGSRCGSLDPGVILYLMQQEGLDAAALTQLLYRQSGLLGVSAISADMRQLLASPAAQAREAIDLFNHRIICESGAIIAALGGLDALIFTGGVGANAAAIRAAVCTKLAASTGLELDWQANNANKPVIHTPTSPIAILALPTNEEWIIARHSAALLAAATTQ